MELRIGIHQSPRELSFETDLGAAAVEQLIAKAIEDDAPIVRFTDDKGRIYLVDRDRITFVEIGAETTRRVGFVA